MLLNILKDWQSKKQSNCYIITYNAEMQTTIKMRDLLVVEKASK